MTTTGSHLDKIITVNADRSYLKHTLWIKESLVGLTLNESSSGGSLAVGFDGVVALQKNTTTEVIVSGSPLYGVDGSHTVVASPTALRSSFVGWAVKPSNAGDACVDALIGSQPPSMAASGGGFNLRWAQVRETGAVLRGNGITRVDAGSNSAYNVYFIDPFDDTNYAVSADPMNHDQVLRYEITLKRPNSFRITWYELAETRPSINYRTDFILIVLPG